MIKREYCGVENDSSALPPVGTGKVEAYSIMTMRWHKVIRSWVRKRPDIYTKWREISSASEASQSDRTGK